MLSGPRGILFSGCHPVANICLSLVPQPRPHSSQERQAPQGHPRPHPGSHGSTDTLTDMLVETDTHGRSQFTRTRDPRRHPRVSPVYTQAHGHTSQRPATEWSADRRQDVPALAALPSRKTTCKQPRKDFLPPLCPISGAGGAEGDFPEGSLFADPCECGAPWRSVGPPHESCPHTCRPGCQASGSGRLGAGAEFPRGPGCRRRELAAQAGLRGARNYRREVRNCWPKH